MSLTKKEYNRLLNDYQVLVSAERETLKSLSQRIQHYQYVVSKNSIMTDLDPNSSPPYIMLQAGYERDSRNCLTELQKIANKKKNILSKIGKALR